MAYAERDGDSIAIATQWQEKELIKALPGSRWDAQAKVWRLPLAWASCIGLRGVFKENLQIGEQLTAWATDYRATIVDPAEDLRTKLELPIGELDVDDERLYSFQRAGVKFITYAGDALLGDEMGTGKTVQALVALRQYKDALPTLVICPNSVKHQWARHVPIWFPEATPYIVEGTAPQRLKTLKQAADDDTALIIINIEATRLLSRLAPFGNTRLKRCKECDPKFGDDLTPARCEVHPKILNEIPLQSVVFDEAHRIKEPKTAQTRAAWAIMHGATVKRRLALTGTPIAQHPGDLWSIMHAVAPYDFPTKSKFIDRFCMTSWNAFGGLDIVGVHPDHREELFGFLDPHFRRVTKAEVLPQLPSKVREVREIEMAASQGRMYKDMESKLQTRTETGELLIAPSQLAKATRLMQLASATCEIQILPDQDPNDITRWQVTLGTPSPKIDELVNVLSDLGDKQCVIAAEHKQLIDLAATRLTKEGIPFGLITGDVPPYEREQALKWLQEKRIRCLLFTVKAGGTGLDMSCVDTLINLQRSWSLVDCVQTEDRVHRIGSEIHESIQIIDLVTRGTIEEDQIERIHEKLERLEEITRDRQRLAALGASQDQLSQLDQDYMDVMQQFIGVPSQEEVEYEDQA